MDSLKSATKITRPETGSWGNLKPLLTFSTNNMTLKRLFDTIEQYDM